MDYGTFFFTNIAIVMVFMLSIGALACYNRRIAGMGWFAGALITGLAKLVLQGLEGKLPARFTDLPANELYLVSFMMQWMGLRCFVVRKPLCNPWPWILIAIALTVYTFMFLASVPYAANVLNVPFVIVCGISGWMMLKYGRAPFLGVSRVTSAVLFCQMSVAGYRAVLTDLNYVLPWETVNAHSDGRWLYSLAAAAFLAACMVMCQLWLLVAELQRELAVQARTDPLTGALNRRAMKDAAFRETARSIRHGFPLSIVMIDIDGFKLLNDGRGHAAGDCALQALVRLAKANLRAHDVLVRTGGEEFAILLPDTCVTAALATAERIRSSVERMEVPFETGPIRITVSAGVAGFEPARGFEAMMRHADAAMYEAKENGRNRVLMHLDSKEESRRLAPRLSADPLAVLS